MNADRNEKTDAAAKGRFTLMLPMRSPDFPNAQAIKAALGTLAPDKEIRDFSVATGDAVTSALLKVGETVIACLYVDQPIPSGELDIAINASILWPNARKHLADHWAHVILANFAPFESFEAARTAAIDLTLLGAAFGASESVIGAYWSHAHTVTDQGRFQTAAQDLRKGEWPLHVWCQYFWRREGRVVGLATVGLRPFFGYEIEFAPAALSPEMVYGRVSDIARYLLSNGPVLTDGHTVGVSARERIRVRHKREGQRPGVPALELTFEAADGEGEWWADAPPPSARTSAIKPAGPGFGRRGR